MNPPSSSRTRAPPSTASLNKSGSVRSNGLRPAAPPISTVITSPPWARDEPPSPKERTSLSDSQQATESRPSDVASLQSSSYPGSHNAASRWWAFTLPRPREMTQNDLLNPAARLERKSIMDRSISWLPTSAAIREAASSSIRKDRDKERAKERDVEPESAHDPYTPVQNKTPGWDSPWNERSPAGPSGIDHTYGLSANKEADDKNKYLTPWQRRKKQIRRFILNNVYVPLLFRFINISLTAAALGVALHIRRVEQRWHVMGAVGSSPTLVIIFAPLTLVHVMIAIYLEYFGRPLGLWRTSALSLAFDNFFTSLIPCASSSEISWYSELPRPAPPDPLDDVVANGVAKQICRDQLSLICLVGVGLIMYCTNLIISLFRIFEKVKYHPSPPSHTV
ncbi:Regulator of phospholipase D Srf1 [Pleurotus pulmonarius]